MAAERDDVHAHVARLTRDQWAWEFLRRNRDYQADYACFIAIWHALEADYGSSPQRDFQRWKQDPRAYGPLPGEDELAAPSGELCTVDDRVVLECWMGAKWGFYKFPPDPGRTTPPEPDELSWRPPPLPAPSPDVPYRLDIGFDLSLPLPEQLESAKFRLVSRTAELRRAGHAAPMTVTNQRERWARMLQLLDGNAPTGEENAALLRDSEDMVRCCYLTILRLSDAGAETK